ncbi:ABC transporter permease [Enterococcus faecalis]|nr:ABC transporter permease [Enterococcus faecalis]
MLLYACRQFKYSWKVWFFALPIFITCSFVINLCLTNFFNFTSSNLVNNDMLTNTQLFFIPIIFGSIMIPIVLKNTVKEMLNGLREQNNLQIILGMNPESLAFLSGVELSIASAAGATVGSVMSTPFAQSFYNFLVSIQGGQEFPPMAISFSFKSFILTLLIITITTLYSGYVRSRRTFYKIQKNIENTTIKSIDKDKYSYFIFFFILFFNIALIIWFMSLLPEKLGINTFAFFSTSLILLEIIAISLLTNVGGKILILTAAKIFNKISTKFKLPLLNLATYTVSDNYDIFKKIYIPVAIINIFVSGFSSLLIDLPDGGDAGTRISNMVIFLGAPLLVTLANTVCMMLLLQQREISEIRQLFILGLRPLDIFLKKEFEIFIYSLTTLVMSLTANFILSLMFIRITQLFNKNMIWINIWLPSLLLSLAIFVLMSIVTMIKIKDTKWDTLEFNLDTDS